MSDSERSTITAIEAQARHPDRVSIFVDGEWVVGVHGEVAAAAGLRVGQAVCVADLQAIARAEELRRARERALALLGYRARSSSELRQRLARDGFDPEVAAEAIERLARSGLIDDEAFARNWVRARTGSRPMGPARIAAELRQKGIERELIQETLGTLDPVRELDLALEAGRRKVEQLRNADPRTARRRLGAALARRGFSPEVCARAVEALLKAEED